MGFSNRVPLSDEMVLTQYTNKAHTLGQIGETEDGRVFIYSLAGGALSAGIPAQSTLDGDMSASTGSAPLTGTTWTSTWVPLVIRLSTTWGSPGGSTGVTANMFQDGYAWVGSTEGKGGQVFRIKSNTTGSSDTGGYTELTMHDGVAVTEDFDTESRIGVLRNPYGAVITQAGGAVPTALIVGVPPRNITSGKYFWLQTGGPAAVRATAVTKIAQEVLISTSTGVAIYSTDTDLALLNVSSKLVPVGITLSQATTSVDDFGLIYLTIRT